MVVAALAGILGIGLRIEGPVGHIDSLDATIALRVIFQRRWCQPQAFYPCSPFVLRLQLGDLERHQRFRFDQALRVAFRGERRAAKSAGARVKIGGQRLFAAAVAALDLFLLVRLALAFQFREPRFETQFFDRFVGVGDIVGGCAIGAFQCLAAR